MESLVNNLTFNLTPFNELDDLNWTFDYYMWFDEDVASPELNISIRVISLLLYCLTFLLGVPGNAFVLYVAGWRMKRTVNTIWFLNLAAADLLCCLSIPFSVAEILLHHHWPYGPFLCKVLPSVVVVSMFASVFTLTLISLDRFTLVIIPVWAQNHRNLLLARCSCVAVWASALALSLPSMVWREVVQEEFFNLTLCTYHGDEDEAQDRVRILSIVRFVLGFVVPLIIITSCYVIIARKLGHSQFRSGRAFRIMLSVVVVFFLCWMLYHIMDLVRMYHQSSVVLVLDQLAVSLAYVNSCLNPVLYGFMGQDFKSRMKLSVRRVFERAFSEDGTPSSQSTPLPHSLSVVV